MTAINNVLIFIRRQPRWRLAAAIAVFAVVAWFVWGRAAATHGTQPTFSARRGPLEITVLEGGSLKALESQEVKCEVRVGYQGTKILRIIPEGYLVTEEDVKTNKVLVELDSSDIQKQIVQQEIQYQTAVANLTDAQQNFEIQVNQNQSDIKAAEQKVRFARLDFDKLLGESITDEIITTLSLDKLLAAATTNNVELDVSAAAASAAPPTNSSVPPPTSAPPPAAAPIDQPPVITVGANGAASNVVQVVLPPQGAAPVAAPPATTAAAAGATKTRQPSFQLPELSAIQFSKYANADVLGDGEAKQKLRKFDDDLQVSQKENQQSQATLEGTRRLLEKGFVTKLDLQRDEIASENSRLKVVTAETARDLYLKYDFNKSAEEALSKYAESVRELDKTRRMAVSKLAQARARLNSGQGQYQVQLRQRNDLIDQNEKCIIRAKKAGLVVYGGAGEDYYYGNQEPIREGATVRERQAIITIPDMNRMAVNVKIHESYIKKVHKGQKARITVDAYPDQPLTGEITMVGVLPDSQNRWMNPDLKVYLTTVTVDGTHEWVKPGMSAKVEILVNKLADVVYIPVQSVAPDDGHQFCYVLLGSKPERRQLEIGEFNDEFIEVKGGLKEGELVLLHPPEASATGPAKKPAAAPDIDHPAPDDKTPGDKTTPAAIVGQTTVNPVRP